MQKHKAEANHQGRSIREWQELSARCRKEVMEETKQHDVELLTENIRTLSVSCTTGISSARKMLK